MAHTKHAQGIQGTQITVESVFISRFTKLQKCWTHKIAFKIISKMLQPTETKFLLQSAFYTSKGSTCEVLPLYDFWFKFYDKFCNPYPITTFYAYLITKIGNRNLRQAQLCFNSRELLVNLSHSQTKQVDLIDECRKRSG